MSKKKPDDEKPTSVVDQIKHNMSEHGKVNILQKAVSEMETKMHQIDQRVQNGLQSFEKFDEAKLRKEVLGHVQKTQDMFYDDRKVHQKEQEELKQRLDVFD